MSTLEPAGTLQTLDRGLSIIAKVAEAPHRHSVADLARQLGVHRAIVYRLVATLEAHRFVVRNSDGRLSLGTGLIGLSGRWEAGLREVATPLLRGLAEESGACAFLSLAEGDECVAIAVAEPERQMLRVSYRVGSRFPLSKGAPGLAILAGRPPDPADSILIRSIREQGYSITEGELQPGAVGIASPVGDDEGSLGLEACVGLVALSGFDAVGSAPSVRSCARAIAHAMRSTRP